MTTPRTPEQEALFQRYLVGEFTIGEFCILWTRCWDARRLETEQAQAVATAVLFLQVQS